MQISVRNEDGGMVVTVAGRLDTSTAGELEEWGEETLVPPVRDLVMDCAQMEYISSAGLRVLLNFSKKLVAASRTFSLCNVQEHVAELLEISGFDTFIPIHDSVEKALEKNG